MCHGVITQGKNRMRQFRTSGSVRGAAREGGSYRDNVQTGAKQPWTTWLVRFRKHVNGLLRFTYGNQEEIR